MKKILLLPIIALLAPAACADSSPDTNEKPVYNSEAPLPKGWPEPGPYNEVTEKTYPKYRAAVTKGGGAFSFWRLFGHIKDRDIPMTAPVEMKIKPGEEKMKRVNMAFLYQDTEVGEIGADGKQIEVLDVEKAKVLSYTWMGTDSERLTKIAREAIEAELKKRQLKATSYRLLGYNGPGTPRKKRTYELQAILQTK